MTSAEKKSGNLSRRGPTWTTVSRPREVLPVSGSRIVPSPLDRNFWEMNSTSGLVATTRSGSGAPGAVLRKTTSSVASTSEAGCLASTSCGR